MGSNLVTVGSRRDTLVERGDLFGEHLVVIALGIDEQGEKHVLGLHEGATENEAVCKT